MSNGTIQAPQALIDALNGWKRFVCVGHVTPDADCLAAMYAIARAWSDDGDHEVCISLPVGSLSLRLGFMERLAGVRTAGPEDFARADGFVVVDTAKASRCNVAADVGADVGGGAGRNWSDKRSVVNIDHHATNTMFGDINWVVDTAASSSELVFQLILQANRPIDPATASLLYAGILTDSCGFSLASTNSFALRTASELVDLGADVDAIGEMLNRSQTPNELNLLKVFYANTHLSPDKRIAYSTADHQEITGAGCSASDIDEQVFVPRSLAGIKMAILFTEGVKGKTRMNFRGEQGINVVDLARRFGGGGHHSSAGAILDCGIAETVRRVLPAANEEIDRQMGERAATAKSPDSA